MKKILAVILAIVLMFSLVPAAFAASDEAQNAADELHALGLFNGTGTNADGTPIYELDRTPTRAEAITVLVNLLGKSDEAKAGNWNIPFTDVADWAKPYVGYAYANGLAKGTSDTTFGSTAEVTASQYLSFVLNALGYTNGVDFQWNKAWELSDTIGLTDGSYDENTTLFTRGDIAIISLSAVKLQDVLADAPYFGVSKDIHWITNATTMDDLTNNILYSFLIGDYTIDKIIAPICTSDFANRPSSKEVSELIRTITRTYPELAGAFMNQSYKGGFYGNGLVSYELSNGSLTDAEIYANQYKALAKAKEIKDELHNKGTITDSMTQLEIANVYYDYLVSLEVKAGGGGAEVANGNRGIAMEYDTAYACLINKVADCGGKAAAFNLLMHLEGISAQGVNGQIKDTDSGHILSRVVLDGTEYFCDWGNKKGISSDISSWFTFNETSLTMARNA